MRIAVLALQGAFLEHEMILRKLGVDCFEVRQKQDWLQEKDALIIPGGESTTQGKLLDELGLLLPIREEIENGLPVFGTCAGLILLSRDVEGNSETAPAPPRLGTMQITTARNAYGRQLGSFRVESTFVGIEGQIPMTFIRAPYIKDATEAVEVLAKVDDRIVAARQGNQLVTAFHPELDADTHVHEYFLNMIRNR
ncbi:pyridoxal 5'-phosphate synthase, glutaminase subunit Pdx2 [Prevotella sp. oral taxon 306 str. F0472]|uniref:pyridoxal 5'-phosphate synthase glutaminase subunit PdxT n=1 Tax=Prevotella sp. oral taxon 306 TaxID=712461 RepID=UPI00025BBA04|nr:pyridoxal 5'-phosphate synthase glutaminase subunit PdxT [Prevotella sp. oral taxon 306]EID34508.1 pyridoxal 5'-phosphate synthase, glutaminase subunit Pdx2 [Prevotella sp. oral taxon 306 str. F0472]